MSATAKPNLWNSILCSKIHFGQAYQVTLLFAFSVFLFACSSPSVSEDGCLPPLEDVAYSTRLDPSKPVPGQDLIVAPLPPWEMVSLLPERSTIGSRLFSRTLNGHIEIWIRNGADWDKNPNTELRAFVFLIYTPDTGEWKEVSAMVSDSKVAVGKLFTAKDGSLWGAVGDVGLLPSPGAKSPLAKYNEQAKKFEFVNEASGIPAQRPDPQGPEFHFWNVTLQDVEGVFWILVNKDGIYRFDPAKSQFDKYAETPNTQWGNTTTAISPNDDIYYLDMGTDLTFIHSINDLPVFRFDTKTKTIEAIGIDLEPWPRYFAGLLVDRQNRLWLGGNGFREPDGSWYQIHRSPVFIVNAAEDNSGIRWIPPKIIMESSDGRLWFDSLNGTTWLDLNKNKWCWFTTHHAVGGLVEDSDRNLWVVADNLLYKLPLGEK